MLYLALFLIGALLLLAVFRSSIVAKINGFFATRLELLNRARRQCERQNEVGDRIQTLIAIAKLGSFAFSPKNHELLVAIQVEIEEIDHLLRSAPMLSQRRKFRHWLDQKDARLDALEKLASQLRERLCAPPK